MNKPKLEDLPKFKEYIESQCYDNYVLHHVRQVLYYNPEILDEVLVLLLKTMETKTQDLEKMVLDYMAFGTATYRFDPLD